MDRPRIFALLPLGRYNDDADVAVIAADRFAEAQPVHAGQHDVQQGCIAGLAAVHQLQRTLGAGGLDDLPACHFQVQGYHFADAGFVLDYQNSFHKPGSLPYQFDPSSTVFWLMESRFNP